MKRRYRHKTIYVQEYIDIRYIYNNKMHKKAVEENGTGIAEEKEVIS